MGAASEQEWVNSLAARRRAFFSALGERSYFTQRHSVFDLTTGVVIYSLLIAALFLGLWFYYDRRDHLRFELERRKTTFHCIRCDRLYTDRAGTHLCKCPRCGHENTRLKF